MSFFETIILSLVLFLRPHGGELVDDPYEAAKFAATLVDLDDTIIGHSHGGKHGTSWLIATSIAGSRLSDLRKRKSGPYAGTAIVGIDAWAGKKNYRVAVKRGWLNPILCPWHRDDGTRIEGRPTYADWSTRGPYDAMMHDKMHLLPIGCFPVEYIDVPLINAVAVSLYAKVVCKRYGRDNKWRNGKQRRCDAKFLRCIWAGIGTCNSSAERKRQTWTRFVPYIGRARRIMRARGDLPAIPKHIQKMLQRGQMFDDELDVYPPVRPDEF